MNEGNVDSITYNDNAVGMRASYTVVYKREDIDSEFMLSELILNSQFFLNDCMLTEFNFS